MSLIFFDSSLTGFGFSLLRICTGIGVFYLLLFMRVRVARLPAKRLSRFFTDHLIVPSLMFVGIIIFFALDPIRCWTENSDDLKVCDRTVIGQAGLVCIILTHFAMSNLSAVFPKRITDQHIVSLRQFATGDLTLMEGIKVVVLASAMCCAFFLFAQYNTRAKMNEGEAAFLIVAGALGTLLLFIMGLWSWKAMDRETRELQEAEEDEAKGGVVAEEKALRPVSKLHWGFQAAGLFASCLHTMWSILGAVTLNKDWESIQYFMVPFGTLLFGIAFISDPNSGEKRFEKIIYFCFVAAVVPEFAKELQLGSVKEAIFAVVWIIMLFVLGHFGLKFREMVAALNDEDLNAFMLEILLKNATRGISGMLFVTFKALNCIIEVSWSEELLLTSMFSHPSSQPSAICFTHRRTNRLRPAKIRSRAVCSSACILSPIF